MTDYVPEKPRLQFSLCLLLFATAVMVVAICFPELAIWVAVDWFYPTMIVTFTIATFTARRFLSRTIVLPCVCVGPIAVVMAYAGCARHYLTFSPFTNWGWAYPPFLKSIVSEMMKFWALNPDELPPGHIDFHAGSLETLYTVAAAGIIAAAILGVLVGMATSPRTRE